MKNITARIQKKLEIGLEIFKVEQVSNSWMKRIHIRILSSHDLLWDKDTVEEFYIQTFDLLDLRGESEEYICRTENEYYNIYDNQIIKLLFDEEENNFIDNLQVLLIEYLIKNKLPAYYLDERPHSADVGNIKDNIDKGIYKGILEDKTYNHPSMKIEWKLDKDTLYLKSPIYTSVINDIEDYDNIPLELIYSEFAKIWNNNIIGKYDWSLGEYDDYVEDNVMVTINKNIYDSIDKRQIPPVKFSSRTFEGCLGIGLHPYMDDITPLHLEEIKRKSDKNFVKKEEINFRKDLYIDKYGRNKLK